MLDFTKEVVAALLWVVVAWRIDKARKPGAERSLWFVLTMFACAITLELPGPGRLANQALAPLGGAAWAWTCCAVLAAGGARSLVVHTRTGYHDGRSRRLHLALTPVALAAVTLSFVFTGRPALPDGVAAGPLSPAAFYAGSVQSLVRWAVWLAFLAWALFGMTRASAEAASIAARATPGRLATGLRLGALGCRIGYGYVALKTAVVAAWHLGADPLLLIIDQTADAIALLSIGLIVAGSTHDAVAARVRVAVRAAGRARALHQLQSLAGVLHQAAPDSAAAITARGIHSRLRRRALGIRDRQLALRHYVDADAPRRALEAAHQAGYRGEQAQAAAEAAWLEAARAAKARGVAPVADTPYDVIYEARGGQNLDEEVRWLLLVADAFAHSPFVRAFAAEAVQQPGRPEESDAATGNPCAA